jgi:hypothetical protein
VQLQAHRHRRDGKIHPIGMAEEHCTEGEGDPAVAPARSRPF